jgi:hypothetical protein
MNRRRTTIVVLALIGLSGAGTVSAVPAFADEIQTGTTELQTPPAKPAKAKSHKRQTTSLEKAKPNATAQYDAPLQLDFDPMKRVILKAEPTVPYQPQVASRLPPPTKAADDTGQAHLAPLLRENSTPESFGDKGSFIDRHEFGIQLRDHF